MALFLYMLCRTVMSVLKSIVLISVMRYCCGPAVMMRWGSE